MSWFLLFIIGIIPIRWFLVFKNSICNISSLPSNACKTFDALAILIIAVFFIGILIWAIKKNSNKKKIDALDVKNKNKKDNESLEIEEGDEEGKDENVEKEGKEEEYEEEQDNEDEEKEGEEKKKQEMIFTGKIYSGSKDKPIKNAKIIVHGKKYHKEFDTDDKGNFEINLPASSSLRKDYFIEIKAEGYHKSSSYIKKAVPDKEFQENFDLEPEEKEEEDDEDEDNENEQDKKD